MPNYRLCPALHPAYNFRVFASKPIIGIVGGIGSGKSFVADLFGELNCLVIHSDKLVDEAYNDPEVQRTLGQWWGQAVLGPDGLVRKKALAAQVFGNPDDRRRLEGLLHPLVNDRRRQIMAQAADSAISAYVWDSPLLLETGLGLECDAIVFVDAPEALRLGRVAAGRGWDAVELTRREKLQWPLDKKREISEYVVDNTAGADQARGQVKDVLFRIRGRLGFSGLSDVDSRQ
jgi:dephospho-CoA kinase